MPSPPIPLEHERLGYDGGLQHPNHLVSWIARHRRVEPHILRMRENPIVAGERIGVYEEHPPIHAPHAIVDATQFGNRRVRDRTRRAGQNEDEEFARLVV